MLGEEMGFFNGDLMVIQLEDMVVSLECGDFMFFDGDSMEYNTHEVTN